MMNKKIQKASALLLAGILTLCACSTASAKKAQKAQVDLDAGKYHATMGIQTATKLWAEHMGYYESTNNKTFGTEEANLLISNDAATGKKIHDGTFTDVEIAGNGTYTLKLEDADFAGETCISQLHIATDIPLNDTIKFTDVKLTIDDKKILVFPEGWMENEETYLEGGMVVFLLNHWRDELKEVVKGQGRSEDADNGYDLLAGTGKENIQIQFTVSGFNYDNPDAVAETPEPVATEAAKTDSDKTDDSNNSSIGIYVGIGVVVVIVIIGGIVIVRRKKY